MMKSAFAILVFSLLLGGCVVKSVGTSQLSENVSLNESNFKNTTTELRSPSPPVQDLYDLIELAVGCEQRDSDQDGKIDAVRVIVQPQKRWDYEIVPMEGEMRITATTLVPLTSSVYEKGTDVYDAEYKINQKSFKNGIGYTITLKYANIEKYSAYLPDHGVISARFVSPGGIIIEGETSTRSTDCVLRDAA